MKKKALVVVLGDLARSPRMQYHCISLAKYDFDVTVVANKSDSDKACDELETNRDIHQRLMTDNVDFKNFLPSILAYLIKPIWQTLLLTIQLLLYTPAPHVIIVQNPPSIPTLPILYIYSRIIKSTLIVDWHNYGYTILGLHLGFNHSLVRIMKYLELFYGRLADAGFCVSEAMKEDLYKQHHIIYPLYVLYDKPPSYFKPLSLREKHEFFLKVQDQIPAFKSSNRNCHDCYNAPHENQQTRFTLTDRIEPYNVIPRPDRPAIVFSSTSWTKDEDFDLLLAALQHYNLSAMNQLNTSFREKCGMKPENRLPDLVCVVTGKGPLRKHYLEKMEKLGLERVEFVVSWLSPEDYARMVGSCDLGISLHNSSSGVDLPMKVVDLFGCGIPTLAHRYEAINELVVEDFYGLTFKDSQDLFLQLTRMLKDFYNSHLTGEPKLLDRYRKNIMSHFLNSRWDTNWLRVAKPVFDELAGISR